MSLPTLLVVLHVISDLVWIGSIAAVSVVLASPAGDARTRGALAHAVYRRLAAPAFGLAFLAGVARLALSPRAYLVDSHWMHGKLTLALVVIALHHVVGGRARALAAGTKSEAGQAGTLGRVLLVAAALAAFLAVAKPF